MNLTIYKAMQGVYRNTKCLLTVLPYQADNLSEVACKRGSVMASSTFLDKDIVAERLVFERLRQSMSKMVGSTVMENFEVRSWQDVVLRGMVIEFTTDLLAQKLADDSYKAHFSYKVPSSWWQHFKQDKAPQWFTNRYPVKYDAKHQTRTVKFTRYATYPLANLAMPKDHRTIELIGYKEILKDHVYQEGY